MRRTASPRPVVHAYKRFKLLKSPEHSIDMSTRAAAKPKRQPKAPKYAKDAKVGDWVHIKGTHVKDLTQFQRWYGSKGASKFVSGIVLERIRSDGPGRKGLYYKVEYVLPDDETKIVVHKAILHFPGKWVDPDPPPDAMSHGTITKTIRPKERSRIVQPPSIINFEEEEDDDSAVSATVESQLTEDSAIASTDASNSTTVEPESEPEPVVQNGEDWFLVKEIDDVDINGTVNAIKWRFVGHDDMYMEPGDDQGDKRSILDYFLAVMPQTTIRRILKETNDKLFLIGKARMLHAELMRFFGVCILITRYDFDNCRDLWSTTKGSKYILLLRACLATASMISGAASPSVFSRPTVRRVCLLRLTDGCWSTTLFRITTSIANCDFDRRN